MSRQALRPQAQRDEETIERTPQRPNVQQRIIEEVRLHIDPSEFAADWVQRRFRCPKAPQHSVQRDYLLILVGFRIGVASSFLVRPAAQPSLSTQQTRDRFDRLYCLWQQLGLQVMDETLLADAISRHREVAVVLKRAFRDAMNGHDHGSQSATG